VQYGHRLRPARGWTGAPFRTTGNLRRSDVVMWSNDPDETWWQQIGGDAIVGDLSGERQ
jgi:hypothetical protein